MSIIRNEFLRFFTAGFAGGALLVAATLGIGPAGAVVRHARPAVTAAAAAAPAVTR